MIQCINEYISRVIIHSSSYIHYCMMVNETSRANEFEEKSRIIREHNIFFFDLLSYHYYSSPLFCRVKLMHTPKTNVHAPEVYDQTWESISK